MVFVILAPQAIFFQIVVAEYYYCHYFLHVFGKYDNSETFACTRKYETCTWKFRLYVEFGNLYVEIPRLDVEKKALTERSSQSRESDNS